MTPSIQRAAEADIMRQVERYAAQRLPAIARRFHASVLAAIDAAAKAPATGRPLAIEAPALAGTFTWPVRRFDGFRIYGQAGDDRLTVLRVLHDGRDVGSVLDAEEPAPR